MELLLENLSEPYPLAAVLIIGINATLFWIAGIRLAPGALPDARRVARWLLPVRDRVAGFWNEQLRRRFSPPDETPLPPLPPVGA